MSYCSAAAAVQHLVRIKYCTLQYAIVLAECCMRNRVHQRAKRLCQLELAVHTYVLMYAWSDMARQPGCIRWPPAWNLSSQDVTCYRIAT